MKINTFLSSKYLIFFILLGAFVVRLHGFSNPLADWHSWRQSDTSAVSRNFVQNGFDVLHPRFDDLSNVASGKDNPNGYRFVEFPIYNILQAGSFILFDFFSLEEWGRLVSIIATLLSILFLYLLVKRYKGKTAAILSAFFYAFLPFTIYYGRTILPDTLMVAASLGSLYFFDTWIEKDSKLSEQFLYSLAALAFTMIAFLLKPYAIFFTLPLFYIAFEKYGIRAVINWKLWLFVGMSVVPLFAWRQWMTQYPEGIPVSAWLFNEGNMRFKGIFFYWLFADRIGRLILGYYGIGFFVLGLIQKLQTKKKFLFLTFLASSFLYMSVMARGNIQHDYYQILIIPSLMVFVGFGAEFLLMQSLDYIEKPLSKIVLVILTLCMFGFGWYFIRDYFHINNPSIVKAGGAVDRLVPKNAKIIALYNGDTTFLYLTKRKGWANLEKSLPEMAILGADFLVIPNPTVKDKEISNLYKVVSQTNDYILFDLKKQK